MSTGSKPALDTGGRGHSEGRVGDQGRVGDVERSGLAVRHGMYASFMSGGGIWGASSRTDEPGKGRSVVEDW